MRNIALVFMLVLLSGCSVLEQFKMSVGLEPESAEVELRIKISDNLNQRSDGTSSPVILRIYELSSPILFRSMDFFSLFENDKASLGDEYVKRHEFQLEVDENIEQFLVLQEETRAIGFAVAFRDINGTKWRYIQDIKERQSYVLDVSIAESTLDVGDSTGVEQIYF